VELLLWHTPREGTGKVCGLLLAHSEGFQQTQIRTLLLLRGEQGQGQGQGKDFPFLLENGAWGALRSLLSQRVENHGKGKTTVAEDYETLRLLRSFLSHPSLSVSHYSYETNKSDFSLSSLALGLSEKAILWIAEMCAVVFSDDSIKLTAKEKENYTNLLFSLACAGRKGKDKERMFTKLISSLHFSLPKALPSSRTVALDLLLEVFSRFPSFSSQLETEEVLFGRKERRVSSSLDLITRRLMQSITGEGKDSAAFPVRALCQISLSHPLVMMNNLPLLNSLLFGEKGKAVSVPIDEETVQSVICAIRILAVLSTQVKQDTFAHCVSPLLHSFGQILKALLPKSIADNREFTWKKLPLLFKFFPEIEPFVDIFLEDKNENDFVNETRDYSVVFHQLFDRLCSGITSSEALDVLTELISILNKAPYFSKQAITHTLIYTDSREKRLRQKALQLVLLCLDFHPECSAATFQKYEEIYNRLFDINTKETEDVDEEDEKAHIEEVLKDWNEKMDQFFGHFFQWTERILSLFLISGKTIDENSISIVSQKCAMLKVLNHKQ
jgi:hypothetical protein